MVGVTGTPAGGLVLDGRRREGSQPTRRAGRRGVSASVVVTADGGDAADAVVGAMAGVEEVVEVTPAAGKDDVLRQERRRAAVMMVGGRDEGRAGAGAHGRRARGGRGGFAPFVGAQGGAMMDQDRRGGEGAVVARRRRPRGLERVRVLSGLGLSLTAVGVAAAGWVVAVGGA